MPSEPALTPGYRLRSDVVLRDFYRLLSAFLAIEPCNTISQNDGDPLTKLQLRYAEDEIIHLLVGTAVSNRLQLEHMHHLRTNTDEMSFEVVDGNCGTLDRDLNKAHEEPLMFREACNKIIHAESIEMLDASLPFLRLYGRKNGRQWMAMVEVIEYVRISFRNFEDSLA